MPSFHWRTRPDTRRCWVPVAAAMALKRREEEIVKDCVALSPPGWGNGGRSQEHFVVPSQILCTPASVHGVYAASCNAGSTKLPPDPHPFDRSREAGGIHTHPGQAGRFGDEAELSRPGIGQEHAHHAFSARGWLQDAHHGPRGPRTGIAAEQQLQVAQESLGGCRAGSWRGTYESG